MKICKSCGELLTLECFSKKSSNKDGLNTRCKECEKARHKKYRKDNKEQTKRYDKDRRQTLERKLQNKQYHHKRRAQCKDSQGLISYEISNEVLTEWFDNKCAYSNKELSIDNINWDHIIPLHLNGVNELWNLIPSYSNYNYSKGAQEPLKWYQKQEYYSDERLEYIIYYQKVMYWNFANKETSPLVLITGETLTYEDIVNEYGELE